LYLIRLVQIIMAFLSNKSMIFFLILACPIHVSSVNAVSVSPPSHAALSTFRDCLRASSPRIVLILPEDGDEYRYSSVSIGSKSEKRPLGIVYPTNTNETIKAVSCAYQSQLPMTVANGRHSFQGLSIQDDCIIIDVTRTCSTTPAVNTSSMTLTMPGGCFHADVLAALHKSNITDSFAITGGMPLVGYVGWATGGGFGNVSPYVGIGCDQFVDVQVVLYNGTVIRANSDNHHADLFRMLCGGGTGVGVITEVTVRLTSHPDAKSGREGGVRYTRMIVSYPLWAVPTVLHRLQIVLSSPTPLRLGGHGPTITRFMEESSTVHFCLLYLGAQREAVGFLSDNGLLSPDLFPSALPRWLSHPPYPFPPFPTIAKSVFKGTPSQLVIQNFNIALRPTLALPKYANIIIAEVKSYPYAMAPMVLIDDRAMNQSAVCNVLKLHGGICSTAGIPHFASKKAHDLILEMTMRTGTSGGNSQTQPSILFQDRISAGNIFNDLENDYRHMVVPGQILDDVLPVEVWSTILNMTGPPYNCSFMVPHLLGGRVHGHIGQRKTNRDTSFSWRNGTLVFGIQYHPEPGNAEQSAARHRHQRTCFHELKRVLRTSHGPMAPEDNQPKLYYNYIGEISTNNARNSGYISNAEYGAIWDQEDIAHITRTHGLYDPHNYFVP
jgi:hypothetical protein